MDLHGIKDITVKAGKDFEVHIPYKATPKAQAQWFVGEKELDSDDRVSAKVRTEINWHPFNLSGLQALDNVVTLVNRKAERGDAGVYKLVLKNSEGASQVQFRVNVLAPPTKPEGPLDVANVTAEGCTLNWKPPVSGNAMQERLLAWACFHRKTMVVARSSTTSSRNVLLERTNGRKLAHPSQARRAMSKDWKRARITNFALLPRTTPVCRNHSPSTRQSRQNGRSSRLMRQARPNAWSTRRIRSRCNGPSRNATEEIQCVATSSKRKRKERTVGFREYWSSS